MKTERVSNLNFNGIYKLKLTNSDNVNKFIKEFVSEHELVIRKSDIFREGNQNYMYAITKDGKMEENIYENDLRKINIPFWKSLSVNKLLNKYIIDALFDLTKKNQGKENWIV